MFLVLFLIDAFVLKFFKTLDASSRFSSIIFFLEQRKQHSALYTAFLTKSLPQKLPHFLQRLIVQTFAAI